MRVPIFTEPSGKVYSYESPTRRVIARNPLTPDPWESDQVYVKESQLPQGGDGLYAKQDLDKARLISLFNGVRLKTATLESKITDSDYRYKKAGTSFFKHSPKKGPKNKISKIDIGKNKNIRSTFQKMRLPD